MSTIVLIACSKSKQTTLKTAQELYSSPLFHYSLRYARVLNPDAIYILSARILAERS